MGEDAAGAGPNWLDQVVEACGLSADVASFDAGLEHDVGVGGGSLSGGQKARVALARAVYSRSRITLLDDPLCALDPGLKAQVFKRVIAAGGLLRGPDRTVVFVTSSKDFLAQCDIVVAVKVGG